jgi:hypothetical protein
MKKIFLNLLLLPLLILFSQNLWAADKDAYMQKDSSEYKELTAKILGNWKISSLVDKENKEKMNSNFKAGSVKLDFDKQEIVIKVTLSDSVISKNITEWRKNKPDLVVKNYEIICTASWKLVWDNPDIIYQSPRVNLVLEDGNFDIVVTGTGNIKQFVTEELVKYGFIRDAAKNMSESENTAASGGDWGSLVGGVMGQVVAQKGTESTLGNTDYLFPLDSGASYNSEVTLKDNNLKWWAYTLTR